MAAAIVGIGFASSVLATPGDTGAAATTSPGIIPPATQKCMNDLRAIDTQMQAAGHWLHSTGFGYGFPLFGYDYGAGRTRLANAAHHLTATSQGHLTARPGYEIRTLIAAATILAQRGQQQECDAMLAKIRDAYKEYAADMKDTGAAVPSSAVWRRKQIASAVTVTGNKGYRADQLIGADVVNGRGDDLGDVYDVVMNRQTGEIVYLVLGRGGVFGIGERHVPVPWQAFKVSPDAGIVVLDSTKANLDAAPTVAANHYSSRGKLVPEATDVDAFWKTRPLK